MEKGTLEMMWKEQFGFLGNRGVGAAYLTLLALAKSARDVEWLHRLLPANCRLPHKQLIMLKEFWRQWFGVVRNERIGEQQVESVLRIQCDKDNLTGWYADSLHNDMVVSPWCQFGVRNGQQNLVHSLTPNGPVHFLAQVFGCEAEIRFDTHGCNMLGVLVVFTDDDLTEELVNSLRSAPTKPQRPAHRFASLHCYYELCPSELAAAYFTPDVTSVMGHKYSVADEKFPAYMEERLQEFGLNITKIEEGPHPQQLHGN